MITSLTAGLKDTDKQAVESEFKQSPNLREQLVDILEKRKAFSTSNDQFSNPNWSEYMAYQIGYAKACEELIKLLQDKPRGTKK